MLKRIKTTLTLFCIFFTCAMLLNSTLNLIFGHEIDTNVHIICRAGLNLVSSLILTVVMELKEKYAFLRFLLPYIVVVLLIFGVSI
ncbi:MAG: hypothetical protein K2N44_08230 [Lachnospiraceae bacterium]|nr:hypothetical protein [Lachnospiraceae bacterium]MDE7416273.1 hypothetical protein [Lachnospiraceae bacterium]